MPYKIKIDLKGETYSIKRAPKTLEDLKAYVTKTFEEDLPSNWILQYQGAKNDWILLSSDQIYQQMLDFDYEQDRKAREIYIKSNKKIAEKAPANKKDKYKKPQMNDSTSSSGSHRSLENSESEKEDIIESSDEEEPERSQKQETTIIDSSEEEEDSKKDSGTNSDEEEEKTMDKQQFHGQLKSNVYGQPNKTMASKPTFDIRKQQSKGKVMSKDPQKVKNQLKMAEDYKQSFEASNYNYLLQNKAVPEQIGNIIIEQLKTIEKSLTVEENNSKMIKDLSRNVDEMNEMVDHINIGTKGVEGKVTQLYAEFVKLKAFVEKSIKVEVEAEKDIKSPKLKKKDKKRAKKRSPSSDSSPHSTTNHSEQDESEDSDRPQVDQKKKRNKREEKSKGGRDDFYKLSDSYASERNKNSFTNSYQQRKDIDSTDDYKRPKYDVKLSDVGSQQFPTDIYPTARFGYKTIRLINTGKSHWPDTCFLRNIEGRKGADVKVSAADAKREVNLTLTLEGPFGIGTNISIWQLQYRDEDGNVKDIGSPFNITLQVKNPDGQQYQANYEDRNRIDSYGNKDKKNPKVIEKAKKIQEIIDLPLEILINEVENNLDMSLNTLTNKLMA